MNCLADENLRDLIDREIGEAERLEAERHIASCAECRKRRERVARESEEVTQSLLALEAEGAGDPRRALARFHARLRSEAAGAPRKRNFMAAFVYAHPIPAGSMMALAALVLVLVTFAPGRSWAQRVLAMLRVQKVTVVPVDFNFTSSRDTQSLIRQVISSDVTVTLSAGKPTAVTDASEASKLTGFPVRVMTGGQGAPQIAVAGEQAYLMTLDQNRLQAILDSFGRTDLQVPASINGQTIAVHIPKAAFLRYGNCAAHRSSANPAESQQNTPAGGSNCVMLAEVPSPVVSVPPNLNINQLFEIALEAAGMSPQQAQAFCQTVDWKSTLVVPIPSRAASSVQEEVDGVEGNLIIGRSFHGRPAEFALIWVKNGIIYSIHGFGDPQQALDLASSLS